MSGTPSLQFSERVQSRDDCAVDSGEERNLSVFARRAKVDQAKSPLLPKRNLTLLWAWY